MAVFIDIVARLWEIANLELEGDGAPDIDLDDQLIRSRERSASPVLFVSIAEGARGFESDRVGDDAVDITMTRACSVAGYTPLPVDADDAGLRLYEEAIVQHPGVTVRHYVFTGGCATVRYSFTRQTAPSIFDQAEDLIGYNLRLDHVRAIRREAGLTLCGAEAPPCPG